jgi:predicted transcriptional regulator
MVRRRGTAENLIPDIPAEDITLHVKLASRRPDSEKVAAALRALRVRSGVTQVDLAKRLGRPQSFISKVERNERSLDVLELLEVLDALGAEAGKFISEIRKRLSR